MSTTSAFVPLSRDQAVRLRDGGDLGTLTAYAVGPDLLEAHGLGAADEEQAGYVALGYAGLGALLGHPGTRTVLAVDVDDQQVRTAGSEFGEVELQGVRWGQVSAVFADEPGATVDLEAARDLAGARALSDVVDDEDVVGLVDRWDLLWYAPAELDAAGG